MNHGDGPRSARAVMWSLTTCLITLIGCGPRSQPLPNPGNWSEDQLDRGRVEVHVGFFRELDVGKNRLKLSPLLDPSKVFEAIRTSRRASSSVSRSVGLHGGLKVSKVDAAEAGAGDAEDAESEGESSSALTAAEAASESGVAPKAAEAPPTAAGLSAPYHQLLYATADSVLGGAALESLYNVDVIPAGYRHFTVPVVISFEPGRVTHRNYVAEAKIDLLNSSCGVRDINIVAVAPMGFASFMDASSVLTESYSAALAAAVPFGAFAAAADVKAALDTVRRYSEVARRPEFQVSIRDKSSVTVRYLGNDVGTQDIDDEDLAENRLQPTTFHAELLLIADARNETVPTAATCRQQLLLQMARDFDWCDGLVLEAFYRDDKVAGAACQVLTKALEVKARAAGSEEAKAAAAAGGDLAVVRGRTLVVNATDPKREVVDFKYSRKEAFWLLLDQRIPEYVQEEVVRGSLFAAPGERLAPDASGQTTGASFFLSTWQYRPTHELAHGGAWSEDHYGDAELSSARVYLKPKREIVAVSEAPGGKVVVDLRGELKDACVCVEGAPPATGAAGKTSSSACFDDPKGASGTLLVAKPESGSFGSQVAVRLSEKPEGGDVECDGQDGWKVVKVAKLDAPPEKKDELAVASIDPIFESEMIVLRIVYDTDITDPEVIVNGAQAKVRPMKEPRKPDQKGAIIFVEVPQKIAPKDDRRRTLHVQLKGKSKDDATKTLSAKPAEVVVRW